MPPVVAELDVEERQWPFLAHTALLYHASATVYCDGFGVAYDHMINHRVIT